MNHPTEDQILLLAYGELPETAAREIEAHVTGCAACRAAVERIERARVALVVAMPTRRRDLRAWGGAGRVGALLLASAAALAVVLIGRAIPSHDVRGEWRPTMTWSATAGYVAGGNAMLEIDAQLTRLEQEWPYGRP